MLACTNWRLVKLAVRRKCYVGGLFVPQFTNAGMRRKCEPVKGVNPQYTKPSSSTLFTKLGSSEDPMVFFVISQQFGAVDYSNYVFVFFFGF